MSVREGFNGLIPFRIIKLQSAPFQLSDKTKFVMKLGVLSEDMRDGSLFIEVPESMVTSNQLPAGTLKVEVISGGKNILKFTEDIQDMRMSFPLDFNRTFGLYSESMPLFSITPGSPVEIQVEFFRGDTLDDSKNRDVNLTVLFSKGGK